MRDGSSGVSSLCSFLQVNDSSTLGTRRVASGLGAGASSSSSFGLNLMERMEWLANLNSEGVGSILFSFLLLPSMTSWTRDGSGVLSFLTIF
jgi:hypothetical protein